MDVTKEIRLGNIFLFLFFVLFPFGQLLRLRIESVGVTLHPLDLVVISGSIYYFIKYRKIPESFKYFSNFLWLALFSLILSFFLFKFPLTFGPLYLLRFAAYLLFFGYVSKKEPLFSSLLAVSLATAVFGWIQYLFFPDMRAFYAWGWDEHLYRLIGTFMDPTFTGLILVLGFIISFYQKKDLFSFFLMLALAFTYSRASYLALLAALVSAGILQSKFGKPFLFIFAFLFLILVLPRPAGEGVRLEREASVTARLKNYSETLQIFQKSPIFGVGLNNLCIAKAKFLGRIEIPSHACSGSDSSLLLVLATTGICGLSIFLRSIKKIFSNVKKDVSGKIFLSSGGALLIHSFFANSIFYPWILGWMLVLLRSKSNRKSDLA